MKDSSIAKPKTIRIYSSNDERFVWEGTTGDLVDDFVSDAERQEKKSIHGGMECFAWALAAIADGWTEGAERELNRALGRNDLNLEIH